ncbi:tetratricopeptide repeat protein [Salisaeta longa]|uniref:tetratricopeptide repeat protein n=1 Tax=Salisaeta longa TaxID=503170 RepID=UPI0003B38B29|nr:tetratricopeptide repeat protein [Salisaeta longa]
MNMLQATHSFVRRPSLLGLLGTLLFLVSVAPAQAQQTGTASEPTKQQKMTHYSLYYEDFKNENYASAVNDLRWILNNAPLFPRDDARNYRRAVTLYAELAKKATDEAKRAAYLDTATTILKSTPEKIKAQGGSISGYEWTMTKGRFMQQYSDLLAQNPRGLKSAAEYYRSAFEQAPKEINPYYISFVLDQYLANSETQKALAFINTVEEKRTVEGSLKEKFASVREQIFGRNPQARVAYLESQLKKSPDNAQVMSDLFSAYIQQGNVEAAAQLADSLMATNPPADILLDVAKLRLENGQPKAAFETYQKAQAQGATLTAEDFFNMGIAQQRMGQLSKARTYFRKALEKNSDFGRAYLAIGDLYVRAVSECGGSNMGRDDRAVYWAAVDAYQEAKSADPNVASSANSKIQTYRQYFPTTEDIFYRSDWEKGKSFTIDYGCYAWINETTTVRPAP